MTSPVPGKNLMLLSQENLSIMPKQHTKLKIAAIQMTSTPSLPENMDTAKHLIEKAVVAGARLVLLPEYWAIMGKGEQDKVKLAKGPEAELMVTFLAEQARLHKIYLIGGTIPITSPTSPTSPDTNKVFN